MLGIFFKYLFLSKYAKNQCCLPIILLICNLTVKQFGSQMKPHLLWVFIWIQIVCKGHQRSLKFTASRLRVKCYAIISISVTTFCLRQAKVLPHCMCQASPQYPRHPQCKRQRVQYSHKCQRIPLVLTVLVLIKLTLFAVPLRLHCGSCKLIF